MQLYFKSNYFPEAMCMIHVFFLIKIEKFPLMKYTPYTTMFFKNRAIYY